VEQEPVFSYDLPDLSSVPNFPVLQPTEELAFVLEELIFVDVGDRPSLGVEERLQHGGPWVKVER
jgi:hypothetical protein